MSMELLRDKNCIIQKVYNNTKRGLIMAKEITYGEALKEISVLVPGYGMVSVERRLNRGDIPLIFETMSEDGRGGLEALAENEADRNFTPSEREVFRHGDHILCFSVFALYHLVTFTAVLRGLYSLAKDLF